MKILHVIPTLSPSYGGPALVCREMAARLSAGGHQTAIFTTNRDYPAGLMDVPVAKPRLEEGVTVTYFPVELSPLLVSFRMAAALARHVADFDVVHVHGLYRFPLAAAAYFARRNRVPYVVRPHGSLDPTLFYKRERRRLKRLYERLVEFPNVNRAAFIHYTTAEEMRRAQFLRFTAPAAVIPNAIETAPFDVLPPPGSFRHRYDLGDAKLILHLGRVDPVKGLDLLVDAFAAIARGRNDVRLAVVGPDIGGHASILRAQVEHLGIAPLTVFTGMLTGADKLAALRDADVFVLPSHTENFGMAVVEAMAARLPVIVSDQVKIWREIQIADAGIATACDAGSIETALRAIVDDSARRSAMGEAGRALVERRFNWDVVLGQLIGMYEAAVARGAVQATPVAKAEAGR